MYVDDRAHGIAHTDHPRPSKPAAPLQRWLSPDTAADTETENDTQTHKPARGSRLSSDSVDITALLTNKLDMHVHPDHDMVRMLCVVLCCVVFLPWSI